MEKLAELFDLMDTWRHLPSYQLERRADLFFALYLPAVLKNRFKCEFSPLLIPEFPIHCKALLIDPDKPHKLEKTELSFKLDYLVLSSTGDKAMFVELKTDRSSRNVPQYRYLLAAKEAGMAKLVDWVLDLFRASKAKLKYFHLLQRLEQLALVELPPEMKGLIRTSRFREAERASRDAVNTCSTKTIGIDIVYVQPTPDPTKDKAFSGTHIISFQEFASVVDGNESVISRRFAKSLREWDGQIAGSQPEAVAAQ